MQRLLRLLLAVMVFSSEANAQCGAGYSQAQINWDAMEFLNTNNSYSGYVTAAQAATQKFTFATQKVTVTHNFTGANNLGVNSTHTGETGSNATGADVQLLGNGAITFTFDAAVQEVKFSVHDIDVSQRVTITAVNGATPVNVALSTITGTALTISNNNSTSARVDATSTAQALTSTAGTVNVTIASSITSFTITTTSTGTVTNGPAANREDGSIFLSDVYACTAAAAFPANYYAVSTPWTGQPGYVLVVVNNIIYQVDPATGKAKMIFTDAGGSNINSLAYDPVKHHIYYTFSLTGSPSTDKTVKKYDYNTGTISTFISDVTTLGIPTYESGVESGAAAFYNGNLYLGIEGYASGGTSSMGRKSNIWRIDVDASGNATGAALAYAVAADNGSSSTNTHDWSDIGINAGILYDFDGSASNEDVYQYNLYTGALTRYTPNSSFSPNQVAVDYLGNMYNVNSAIAKYNGTTNLVTGTTYNISATGLPASGSFGDAAEAFKPMGDLGDAPATYDPVALSPAVHEVNTSLRLGAAITSEWTKATSATATGDADDGMPTPTIVINNSNYVTNVNVFNNTGASATVAAWVDFNSNGTFEASEGITTTVPSSSSMQTVQLFWPTPASSLVPYSYTFIRVRITSATNGMTTSNATGYYNDGEVEDYRVQVNAYLLPSELVSFEARKDGARAQLRWSISDELAGTSYSIQRSADAVRWEDFYRTQAMTSTSQRSYMAFDQRPYSGTNYYRLQVLKPGGAHLWSMVRELTWSEAGGFVISPNPAAGAMRVNLVSEHVAVATLRIYTEAGALVLQQELKLPSGASSHPISLPSVLPAATYIVELQEAGQRRVQRLVLRR